jgi:hypothetical protein
MHKGCSVGALSTCLVRAKAMEVNHDDWDSSDVQVQQVRQDQNGFFDRSGADLLRAENAEIELASVEKPTGQ